MQSFLGSLPTHHLCASAFALVCSLACLMIGMPCYTATAPEPFSILAVLGRLALRERDVEQDSVPHFGALAVRE